MNTVQGIKEGSIRLVGGSYNWEGRVQIYLGGTWGNITGLNSHELGAMVVCRQLGFPTFGNYNYVTVYAKKLIGHMQENQF